ncbi:mechanosensitive ion channel family protein [Rufibacter immobilis]|uniref:Mechanosensitive ion channel family protein n=1 Tax=Rufibacter immobilis TaxID=1348778 RepID=A0A3M9MWH8_9BACT|nr:mechanosensitive ion channel domain-containing protein [Rufibacter immobilis]RNI29840.1 mechanosensitive ion channel family protein [Rufibacter immobilis]
MELLDDLSHLVQNHLPLLLEGLGVMAGSLLLGGLFKWFLFRFLSAYNRRFPKLWVTGVLKCLDRPLFYFLPLLVLSMSLPLVPLRPDAFEVLRRVVEILLTSAFAWTLIGCVYVVQYRIRHKYQLDKADNFRERKLFTQLQFVKKMVIIMIVFFTVSLILMSFPTVRKIGTGLVTSAGIVGVILGFAAQRSLANLLAGFQIAFTQPIRLDDVLVVENEWGRVEEITLTYVVLRIWDQRRLILPLNYFIEKPFQNWTRTSVELLGTVFMYLDYKAPLEEMRKELTRLLPQHHLWDGRVGILQVTDFKERTMEVRILVSAADSGSAFDLRCWVREKMISFLQQHYPEALPVTRTAGTGEDPKLPFVPMEEASV